MSRTRTPTPRHVHGLCRECYCTDDCGCAEGCWWSDPLETICSICSGLSPDERAQRREELIDQLSKRIGELEQAAVVLTMRRELIKAHGSNTR